MFNTQITRLYAYTVLKNKKSRWKTREEWEWCRLEYKAPTRFNGSKYQKVGDNAVAGLKITSIDVFYARVSKELETARLIMDKMRNNSTEWD